MAGAIWRRVVLKMQVVSRPRLPVDENTKGEKDAFSTSKLDPALTIGLFLIVFFL